MASAVLFSCMGYFTDLANKIEAVNIDKEVAEIIDRNPEYYADLNRWQLAQGKNNEGTWLPRYIDDPFFKSMAQAKGYEKWKRKISPNRSKPSDIMDFYINGWTHSKIKAKSVGDKELDIFLDGVPFANSIQDKTDGKALGLSPESANEALEEEILPHLVQRIKDKTGL